MDDEAYQLLRSDLIDGHESSMDLHRRLQEVKSKEEQWRLERNKAEAEGREVPNLFKDEVHAALVAERRSILDALQVNIKRPRLDGAAQKALRARLSPEQRNELRKELLHSLQSLPPEVKAQTIIDMERVAQQFREKHGSTEEVETALAKVEALNKKMLEG